MRSAGCIFNDIVDKDFDKKVQRTKLRPIASGKITIKRSLVYVSMLCALAFLILIQFNFLTIMLGLSSMILAFSYPFMKRITYWPQLFLGITFNWGIVMAWCSINNHVSQEIILLYIAAIFWTLGYDTIYGAQDMSDDEIIGVKSTAIKFKEHMKLFVIVSYIITIFFIFYLFLDTQFDLSNILISFFAMSLIYQVYNFKINNPISCLNTFKINNLSGLLLFFGIYLKGINYGI
jgi:4-hydroxybenzoate polyprenyl transferase